MEPITETSIIDAVTTSHLKKATYPNKTIPLVTDAEVNRFVDSLITLDDFELDTGRKQLISIKGIAMKQISVFESETKVLDAKMGSFS